MTFYKFFSADYVGLNLGKINEIEIYRTEDFIYPCRNYCEYLNTYRFSSCLVIKLILKCNKVQGHTLGIY